MVADRPRRGRKHVKPAKMAELGSSKWAGTARGTTSCGMRCTYSLAIMIKPPQFGTRTQQCATQRARKCDSDLKILECGIGITDAQDCIKASRRAEPSTKRAKSGLKEVAQEAWAHQASGAASRPDCQSLQGRCFVARVLFATHRPAGALDAIARPWRWLRIRTGPSCTICGGPARNGAGSTGASAARSA